jgi:type IV secretory pathway VirJ component
MRKIVLGLLVVLLALGGFLAHIGYFGGELFRVVPAERPSPPAMKRTAVILFSGDMGFRVGMGPKMAERLAHDGIPVLGVNSMVYYRTKRTPQEATALVVRAIRRALAMPGIDRVVLLGQSFGADMLHVGLAGMDSKWRPKIAFVALVVPGDTVDYRISPIELIGWEKPDAVALPTASKLNWVPAICIWGEEETDSLCPKLDMPNIALQPLSGNHHLSHNSYRLTRVLEGAMERALQVRQVLRTDGNRSRNTIRNVTAPDTASRE